MLLVRKTFFIIKIIHLCFSLMQDVNNESCRINGNTQTVFFARFKKKSPSRYFAHYHTQ